MNENEKNANDELSISEGSSEGGEEYQVVDPESPGRKQKDITGEYLEAGGNSKFVSPNSEIRM